jgi:serine/threonine-protein kinase
MVEEESLPRLLAKRYRLDSRLGSGGMGVVYRAMDLVMQRQVAVKLVRNQEGIGIDEEVAGRFVREAKHTARIQHENIIEVFDLGRSERGDLFFAMELVEGESLANRIRTTGRFGPHSTIHIGVQICAALAVAHAHGIIHRDLKPANIMLVERAGDPDFVKVLDFGVAKAMGPDQGTSLTQTGMLIGTVEYMSPEQIMARGVDARSDVYSLGVVLYRMLTGKPPFRDAGVPAIIHSHLNLVPPSLVQIAPDVPLALDRVVMRCLAKDPGARYQTMDELAGALEATLSRNGGLVGDDGDAGDDPYGFGDKTEIASRRRTGSFPGAAAAPAARAALAARAAPGAPPPEEATVRLDRSAGFPQIPDPERASPVALPVARPAPFVAPPHAHGPPDDSTLVMQEDLATAKRSIPEEVALLRSLGQPKTCAMCQTVNPAHSRACGACGVSLAAEDQAAVAARVAAPRVPPPPVTGPSGHPPGHSSGQHAGSSGAYPQQQGGYPSGAYAPPQRPPGPQHFAPTWGMVTPAEPAARPSAWRRFLAWTGLGGR